VGVLNVAVMAESIHVRSQSWVRFAIAISFAIVQTQVIAVLIIGMFALASNHPSHSSSNTV
jgi:hypothetical protein